MNDSRPPLLPLVLAEVPEGLRLAIAQEGVPFVPLRPGAARGRFLLVDGRRRPCSLPAEGQVAIDVGRLGDGPDGDPFEALVDEQSRRCQWQVAGLTLEEEIARVDKRAVRRQVLARLRTAIEQAGGIWLRVSAFPFPYHSAFNFRIDYDQYHARDFAATLDALAGHEQATSHFLAGSAYEKAGEAVARLRGLDVGSHGFRHHTYRSEGENLHNLRRGIEALASVGLEPRGFVAPHGQFNRGLLAALESLGIPYSSEFGLAYDELPFFPTGSDVLQIPVHPICLGLFLDALARQCRDRVSRIPELAEAAVDGAVEYFEELAAARYRSGEPVFLYGHPTGRLGRYPRLLGHLFRTVAQFGGIWRTTMSEFAAWWRLRSQVRLTVRESESGYVVSTRSKPAGHRVGIEYWRGEHVALMPLDRPRVRFSPGSLAFERRAATPAFHPVRLDRPEGLRGRIRRMLDWERVTPIDEIGTGTWRNWAKRTLRQLWRD